MELDLKKGEKETWKKTEETGRCGRVDRRGRGSCSLYSVLRITEDFLSMGSRTLLVERVAYCMHNTGSCVVASCMLYLYPINRLPFLLSSALPPLLSYCMSTSLSDVRVHGNENGDGLFLNSKLTDGENLFFP